MSTPSPGSSPVTESSAPAPQTQPQRLVSVDALRGFDMFWIIGGEELAKALEPPGGSGGAVLSAISTQLKHVFWEGFHFYDAIFPLFLFLVGVSIVLSLDRLVAKAGRRGAFVRIVRRSVLLFAVGVFYYGGVTRAWPDVQLSGVLPRIAVCYFFAATLHVLLPRKGVVIAAAACLAGYWAMMMSVPFPDVRIDHGTIAKKTSQVQAKAPSELLAGVTATVSGTFEEGHNLANYADFRWLPGRKRNLYYSSEGLLSTIPAVATTLFGIMAGWVLTGTRMTGQRKVAWLLAAGAAGVALGLLWGLQFPIIKRIWTSSFALLAGGCAAMALGVFYLIVDVWGWKKWCAPFVWIGTNALTVYLATSLLDFDGIARRFVGGDVGDFLDAHVANGAGEFAVATVALLLPVLLVRFLYQRKIFIRL